MEIRILGSLEVVGPGGRAEIAGARRRALLARLVIAAGHVVPTDRLVDDLWHGDPPRQAVKSLQMQVAHLRRALDDVGLPGSEVLVTRPVGYEVQAPGDALDAVRFERLVTAGRDARRSGAAATASERLREALALWRGRALADVDGEPFAVGEAVRLEELRLTALEERIEADLALGAHHQLVAELESLVDAHPLRERLWGQLILASYRAERQADALRAYQRAREALADLGVEPTIRLRELEQSVLVQDGGLDWRPPPAEAAPAAPDAGAEPAAPRPAPAPTGAGHRRPHGFPRPLTSFIGRRLELARVEELLAGSRLVTLTGGGGCGKTRVAVEVGRRVADAYAEGTWFADLSRVDDPADVAGVVGSALRLGEGSGASLATLCDRLAERELVLVLDNCEHVVEACAELAECLLLHCPDLTVLATSREALGVSGETVWRVPSLGLPPPDADDAPAELARWEAVELFVARARAGGDPLPLGDDALRAVARICRRLDGIPLAVELAAALVANLPLDEIARRLDDRLDLLDVPRRGATPRQRTMEATIDWSYDLLTRPERDVFLRLSVLVGEFSLATAEAVAGTGRGGPDVGRALAGLVSKSLVQVVLGPLGAERYRLLEPIRQYGLARLERTGELAAVRRAHAVHFAGLAEAVDAQLHGPRAADWLREAERELPNFRAALEWCFEDGELEAGLRLAGALRWFFSRIGHLDEARAWLDRALGHRAELPPSVLLLAVTSRSLVAYSQGDFSTTMALGEEGVELARRLRDRRQLSIALIARGAAAVYEGHAERSIECFEEASVLCQELGDEWGTAWLLSCWAVASRRAGDTDTSTRQLEEALARFHRLGDEHGQVLPLVNLALALRLDGRVDDAAARAAEALALAQRIGDRHYQHIAACTLGRLELDRGRRDEARGHLLASLREVPAEQHHTLTTAMALEALAVLAADRHHPDAAATLWGYADALRARTGTPLTGERVDERLDQLDRLRTALGDDRLDAARHHGGAATLATVVQLAVEATEPAGAAAPATAPA